MCNTTKDTIINSFRHFSVTNRMSLSAPSISLLVFLFPLINARVKSKKSILQFTRVEY